MYANKRKFEYRGPNSNLDRTRVFSLVLLNLKERLQVSHHHFHVLNHKGVWQLHSFYPFLFSFWDDCFYIGLNCFITDQCTLSIPYPGLFFLIIAIMVHSSTVFHLWWRRERGRRKNEEEKTGVERDWWHEITGVWKNLHINCISWYDSYLRLLAIELNTGLRFYELHIISHPFNFRGSESILLIRDLSLTKENEGRFLLLWIRRFKSCTVVSLQIPRQFQTKISIAN